MPYIKAERRYQLDDDGDYPSSAGELNYMITREIKRYWDNYGERLGYQAISDISSACNEALAEFRRKVVVPYEEKKIEQNGGIY